MNKNTINNLLLIIGIILLLYGFYNLINSELGFNSQKQSIIAIISGVFIVSKRLTKTKELPSKKFKGKLRNKD